MKKPKKRIGTGKQSHDDWEFFDDCEICQMMKKAKMEGREPTKEELEKAFHHQNHPADKFGNSPEKLVYIFETRPLEDENILRVVAISADTSLYELADVITDFYEFDFDHSFGFFDKVTAEGTYHDSKRSYELFTDLIEEGEDLEPTGSGSVKKTKISSVWGKPGEEMMFLFDYGVDWRFRVRLVGMMLTKNYDDPELVDMFGKAPKQYE